MFKNMNSLINLVRLTQLKRRWERGPMSYKRVDPINLYFLNKMRFSSKSPTSSESSAVFKLDKFHMSDKFQKPDWI